MKQENVEAFGEVTEALGNSLFKVLLDAGTEVVAHISGKIRTNYINIRPGDRVKMELSPYDLTKGRIVSRLKKKEG